MHFFGSACPLFFFVHMCPGPDCDQSKPFYFSWFWTSTWQIQRYTHFLSFHPPHFCTKHWHSAVWRKPAGRKGSVSSCGGVEAWQFLGWNSNERPCSFLLPSNGFPPPELEAWVYEGSVLGVCMGGRVPSCCHGVCQVQHYNSGCIVWPVCLFCSFQEERSCSPFHLPLVSTWHATFFLHWISHLSEWKQGSQQSRTNGESNCC